MSITRNSPGWSFDLALNALKIPNEIHRLSSLDKFFNRNIKYMMEPSNIGKKGNFTIPSTGNIEIRGEVLEISREFSMIAEEIAELLEFNTEEVYRIVMQTAKRVPLNVSTEKSVETETKNLNKQGPSKEQKYSLIIENVLKERRTIFEILRYLLTHDSVPVIEQKYSDELRKSSTFCLNCIEYISSLTDSLLKNHPSSYTRLIKTELTLTLIELLKLLSALMISITTISSNVVKWFELLQKTNFLNQLEDKLTSLQFKEIQSLISINSLLLLGLNTNDDIFDTDLPLLRDETVVRSINDILSTTRITAILSYAWGIILNDIDDSLFEKVFGENSDNISTMFAVKAARLDVFKEIRETHEILSYDNIFSAIISSFLITAVPYIQLTEEISETYLAVFSDAPNAFVEKFFTDPNTQRLLYISRAKFPEIIGSYLRILSINGAFSHSELSQMNTYMKTMKINDFSYEYNNETDSIVLKNGVYITPPYEANKNVSLYLPEMTKGKLVPTSDSNTEGAIFYHNYNGWCLIGRIFQNISLSSEEQPLLIAILDLLTNTVFASNAETVAKLLEELSTFTDDGDIVDAILKTFEQSLHQRNTVVLSKIIHFLIALLEDFPQIIWAHLMRSDLLEHSGRGGLIGVILGSVETVNGKYDFTISTLKLYHELVLSSLYGTQESLPHKAEIIPKFTNYAVQLFESFIYWEYLETHQKFQIGTLILNSFSKILYSVYGIDPDTEPSQKVTSILAASSKRIIECFTVSLPDARIIKPILSAIDLLSYNSSFEGTGKSLFWFEQWSRGSLNFSKLVVSIRSAIAAEPSTLEKALFAKSTELVDIYSRAVPYRSDVLQLLTQLVIAKWPKDPPSLLSFLGDHYTDVLLSSIAADLESEYDDFSVKKYLYDFFSAIIEGNQKGLSMIFLNGRDIRTHSDENNSILSILKRNVKHLDYYPESLSIHLVNAIAFAFNSWSSRRQDDEDVEFIKTLVKKLVDFQSGDLNERDNTKIIQSCYRYKLNSRISEICALLIFTSRKDASSKPIVDVLTGSNIMGLIKPLYEPFGYRTSLHANLSKNFQDKWPSMKLEQFVRAPLAISTRYGEGAVYDLRLLDDILQDNEYWTGNDDNSGYRNEVVSASVNFQYVLSQISAAKSWGALLTAYVKKNGAQASFLEIIKKLLEANISEGVRIPLFSEIYRVRIELSFFLLHSFKKKNQLSTNQIKEILRLALELIISSDVNFLSNVSLNNSEVYRPLLRIISSTLSSAKNDSSLVEELTGDLLEFFEIAIAKGTTVLLDAIQSDIKSPEIGGRIEDLYLIISLFKGIVGTKPSPGFVSKMSTMLVDYGTLKGILNVYSSSHLLKVNDEPIFADLTLTFMIELVSEDTIAENLISSGLFSILIQSPISLAIQEGNIFVQTTPRYHSIWSNGLLIIILTLLSKFGARLLPEICVFVGYFIKQFTSTIQSWSQDTVAITIPALHETEQILLLQRALKVFYSEFGISSTKVSQQSIEIVPGLESNEGRKALANSLSHLLAHPKFLTSRVIPTTLEEQKLFEGEDKVRTPLVDRLVSQINYLKQSLSD